MIFVIAGKRGTGKTQLLLATSYYASKQCRVIAFDPMNQFPRENVYPLQSLYSLPELPRLMVIRDSDPELVAQTALNIKNCVLALDELDLVCSKHQWKSPSVREIVLRGRHHNVGLIGNTQRFVNVHNDLLSLAETIAIFRTDHPLDLKRIGEWLGPDYEAAMGDINRNYLASGQESHEFIAWPHGQRSKLL
jgi:hypothetical protein